MKMTYKRIGAFTFGVLLLVVATSMCTQSARAETASSGISALPVPKLSGSVEQTNIATRLTMMNDPSTTMFFYGLSETGTVIFRSVVKGKVTSSTKRLEPLRISCDTNNYNDCWESIQADGTYGTSDQYVYWFDFAGNYFQWNGKYILTSQPLSINTPLIEFQKSTEVP